MGLKAVLAACALCLALPALAEHPPFQTAKVISQDIGVADAGYAVVPVGTGLAAGRLGRKENIVVVETEGHRYTWQELTRAPNIHRFIVLTVNDTVSYYRDGDKFVVLDSKNKEHKFSVIHAEAIN